MILRGRDPATGDGLAVTMADGRIAAIEAAAAQDDDPWLAPGLVDLQLNGFAEIDLNDGECTAARVSALCQAVARSGTTTFLPTLITAPQPRLVEAARAIAAACEADPFAAHMIAGLHLEGPCISPLDGYRGAHPLANVRPPSMDELLEIDGAGGGHVRLVTLSPHWSEAPAFVRALSARGIICAIGHTHATPAQIAAAVDAGARLGTHLGNALPPMLPRHENPIWSQLADDRLSISLIADGLHLAPEMLRVMLRAKGLAGCILVSDAVALAGMPSGRYRAAIGGDVLVGEDGSVRMGDTGLLAGSGISLATAVARCASSTGTTLADALAMATRTPARLLGLDRGALAEGAAADLLAFHYHPGETALSLAAVVVRGEPLNLSARESS